MKLYYDLGRASGLASWHYWMPRSWWLRVGGTRNGQYYDQLPDPKSAGQNGTDYGNNSVRVFIALDRSAIPLSGLSKGSQVDAEGRMGG